MRWSGSPDCANDVCGSRKGEPAELEDKSEHERSPEDAVRGFKILIPLHRPQLRDTSVVMREL